MDVAHERTRKGKDEENLHEMMVYCHFYLLPKRFIGMKYMHVCICTCVDLPEVIELDDASSRYRIMMCTGGFEIIVAFVTSTKCSIASVIRFGNFTTCRALYGHEWSCSHGDRTGIGRPGHDEGRDG